MPKLLFDFSKVLLFPTSDEYVESLNKHHAKLSQDESYQFLDHFRFNDEILGFIGANFKPTDCYIFTTDTIQDTLEVQQRIAGLFGNIFSANKMNLSKRDSHSYKVLACEIGSPPSDITFIDDSEINLSFAKEAGFRTIHYTDNQSLIRTLKDDVLSKVKY